MNRNIKKIISLCLIIVIMSLICSVSNAEVKLPSILRIGLFFTDTSEGVNTAVSSFTVNAQKGLQIGFNKDNKFNLMFEIPSNNILTIRKDSYFLNLNGTLKEYNQLSQTIPEGKKIGPYHIQIGSKLSDLNAANEQVTIFKKLGIPAFPVYIDQWQVWTGFYTDSQEAENDFIMNIKPKLSPEAGYKIIKPVSNRIVVQLNTGDTALMFGSDTYKFLIHPKQENDPDILKINNKSSFRGDLEVRRFASSDMTIINILTIDQYLYGVVPPEIGSAPIEALKAQALAAKDYAFNSMGTHSKLDFDLCTTTDCQVYNGFDVEKPESNKAIDAVTDKLLTYQGKPITAFFFSSSGGMTEDSKNVLSSGSPYLVSVEDKYESGKSNKYNWVVNKTANNIKQIMLNRSCDIGNILSVQISKTAETGRATELIISGTKSNKNYIKSSTRTILGLPSQMYKITTDADTCFWGAGGTKTISQLGSKKAITGKGLKTVKTINNSVSVIGAKGIKKVIPIIPENYTFTGKGNGHAVGMSQEGAIGMAKAGFTYDQILKHYYQGTEIE